MKYKNVFGKTPNDWCCISANLTPSQLRALKYMVPECIFHNEFDKIYKIRTAQDLEWYMNLYTSRGLRIAKELPFQIRYPKNRHNDIMEAINRGLTLLRA